MATKNKNSNSEQTTHHIDLNPACEWKKEERLETLIINLPEFKREQLRVQVNNKERVLKVTGERPTKEARIKKRFAKEVKLNDSSDINEIRAKFINSELHITIPKKLVITPPPTVAAPDAAQQQPESKPLQQFLQQEAEAASQEPKPSPMGTSSCSYDNRTKVNEVFEQERTLQRKRRLIIGFGIAAVTMVAIGAFVASKYGTDSISPLYMEE